MNSSSSSGQPLISLVDVSLRLFDRIMFEHTAWQIRDDQQWAVIGPNGAGKSTLMRALCGQVPVVGGEIVYHTLEAGALARDHIAYVSFDAQRAALRRESPFYQARWNTGVGEDALPVAQYLSESRVQRVNPYQVSEERPAPAATGFAARRERIVALLEIGKLLGRDVVQLSNGERRKVQIARALLREPDLLILDNPFTGLDQRFRARLRELVGRFLRDEMRVMVVTARAKEIPPGVTHVLVVEDGQVAAQGSREAILGKNAVQGRSSIHTAQSRSGVEAFPRGDLSAAGLSPPTDRFPHEEKQATGRILVQMNGVSVSYDGTRVLDQVDWTVRQGQHWALLGPNGAGKTTLLSLILGDNPQAYANDITLFGRRRGSGESIWEIKRHIGWVSPELHLYYPKNIACSRVVCSGFFDSVGLYHGCSPQQRETARSWMQRVRISQYADRTFGSLSQGEQRMVLIARALVKRPQLLVLDEPCQGLDVANRERVLRTVDALEEHLDASLIYVTHDHDALPQAITHVIRLDEGKVAAIEQIF